MDIRRGRKKLSMAGRRIRINGNAPHDDPLAGTGWLERVPALASGRHRALLEQVAALRAESRTIYPAHDDVLRALQVTPWTAVRVVILGQDPYHGPGQAHGLSFSVPEGVPAPRSLRNIFREIDEDLHGGVAREVSTDLTRWAQQGVLLLNTVLTVEEGLANSHARLGWEDVTSSVVQALGQREQPLAFILWGRHAARHAEDIASQHLVLRAAHPSPLSASRGFFGCRHFSQVNNWLKEEGQSAIDW